MLFASFAAILMTAVCSQTGFASPNGLPGLASRKQQAKAIPPRGIVIYKRHVQADEHAPYVEYSSIRVVAKATIDIVRYDGHGITSIPRQQMVHHLVYPQETAELFTETQFLKLKERLLKFQSIEARYQKTSQRLAPWIARLKHEVTMWEDGFCRINGQWVNRVGFRYEQQIAELRRAFAERRAQILGTTYPMHEEQLKRDDSPLPPMWAVDLEQQLREEEAVKRAARKKEAEQAKRQRSQHFLDKVEQERPFRTGWRLEK